MSKVEQEASRRHCVQISRFRWYSRALNEQYHEVVPIKGIGYQMLVFFGLPCRDYESIQAHAWPF